MEEAAKEAAYNPEEINIGDDDEDDEGSEEVVKAPVEVELEKKIIPTEVRCLRNRVSFLLTFDGLGVWGLGRRRGKTDNGSQRETQ